MRMAFVYVILKEQSSSELENKVIEYLTQDYIPVGGVSVDTHPIQGKWYHQAMIKKEWISQINR